MRPFRFGVQVSRGKSGEHWARVAREAESLGYSSLLMPDHFGDQLAPVPALMAAACATERIKVGGLVFCNDYKHPVVLAKEAATIDLLCGGRFEMGIGAGWMSTDYESAGLQQDPPGVRIDRMVEGLSVMRALWADGPATVDGRYYRIRDLDGLPKPVQRPGPRVIIGGGGRKMLTAAARHADIVGINVDLRAGAVDGRAVANMAATETDEKVAWVKEAAGARFADIELTVTAYMVAVTHDREAAVEQLAAQFGGQRDIVTTTPHALVGSVDSIVDILQARRERWGLSYIVVAGEAMRPFAPVIERLNGR